MRAIALLSEVARSFFLQVETVASVSIKNLDLVAWDALFAPAGTPTAIVDRFNWAITAALSSPELRESLLSQGVTTTLGSSEAVPQYLKEDIPRWALAVKRSGAKLD